jgi:hypothetical protein
MLLPPALYFQHKARNLYIVVHRKKEIPLLCKTFTDRKKLYELVLEKY